MRARRVTLVATLAALLSALAVTAARAAEEPALTTPGAPVVVANEAHRLTLAWSPATWKGEPGGPITYDVLSPVGPHAYRGLGSTQDPTITLTNLAPGTAYRIAVQAYAIGGYSDTSPVTVVRTVDGRATVDYRNLDWSPTNNQAQFQLRVTNTGDGPLRLDTVRIRYHVLFEGGNTSLVPECDWAELGCAAILRTVQFFPPPAPPPPNPTPTVYPVPGTPVPGWVEVTFAGGVLAPGGSTGPIQLRLHRANWTNLDERDDPSWQAAVGAWTRNDRITLDVDGVREFGDT
ncbi:cellulose binding domain-containing protein [Micromonospora sp. KC723]|uniref:cellulose binding domain-containing protein n=1 Tax=Micromonospora sp. KC723 TaxID=2530381 RepID=UPI0010471BD9|nr:cellulose binding domain-containing protein [Micromonospora sp. KC723]TDB75840.1 glycosyl hydrolase family 5 [Micromonospora sp. KC723]